ARDADRLDTAGDKNGGRADRLEREHDDVPEVERKRWLGDDRLCCRQQIFSREPNDGCPGADPRFPVSATPFPGATVLSMRTGSLPKHADAHAGTGLAFTRTAVCHGCANAAVLRSVHSSSALD